MSDENISARLNITLYMMYFKYYKYKLYIPIYRYYNVIYLYIFIFNQTCK